MALSMLYPYLDEEEIEKCRLTFKMLDKRRDGQIRTYDLLQVCFRCKPEH